MVVEPRGWSPLFFAAGLAVALSPSVAAAKSDPKPIEAEKAIKAPPGEGYFDDVFALDAKGGRIAALRTDGATFFKLEIIDVGTAKVTRSTDLPGKTLLPTELELLPEGKGTLLIAREKPDDQAPLYAFHFDDAGKLTAKVGPAVAFGRPPADGTARAGLLVAFDQKMGTRGAEGTYTIVPYDVATLAPSGKARVYHTDVAGELKAPVVRLIGFFEGYSRALGERPGSYDKAQDLRAPPRMVVVDALTGKVASEKEIGNIEGWAVTGLLRRDHPGRSLFVELNQDGSGVDVVDAMGKKQPAALAVPFRFYDPKSLRVEEGPAPGALTFGIAVDPLNPDALKRKKTDLPMLDVYTADVGQGTIKLRGRVFTPRPVAWRTAADKLVVLKRFKSFSRGGDELQIYDLR
jgi:hypothetical protein